ncbi:MAG: hypothetical protein ACRCXT_23050 [Paraclostridium sp.]
MDNGIFDIENEIFNNMKELSLEKANENSGNIDDINKKLNEITDESNSNFMNMKFEEDKEGKKFVTDGFFILPFRQDKYAFMDTQVFVKFIKKCEYLVRNHPDYKGYISHLKNHGLNHCMILGDLEDESCSIEMHHGPILNLFDYCTIIANHYLKTKGDCNTFEVAKLVIEEHNNHNIQLIMLSSSMHQMVEANNTFINVKQSFGNLEKFINKYRHAISDAQRHVIEEYLKMCESTDTTVDDILKVRTSVKKWSK